MKGIKKEKNKFIARISINGKRIQNSFDDIESANSWLCSIRLNNKLKSLPNEVWKIIPNFNRYMASNLGRIKSLNYKNSGIEKLINPSKSTDGYLKTMLKNNDNKYCSWEVHKFVMRSFYGNYNGLEVNHKDGNKLNNQLTNLEICTKSENAIHAINNGLWEIKVGEKNGMAKLTKEQVIQAREAKKNNGRFWGRKEIAKSFNISEKHLQKIVNNPDKLWYNA